MITIKFNHLYLIGTEHSRADFSNLERLVRHLVWIQLYSNQSCIEPADFNVLEFLKDKQYLNVQNQKTFGMQIGN
jgi:hypothetical protein